MGGVVRPPPLTLRRGIPGCLPSGPPTFASVGTVALRLDVRFGSESDVLSPSRERTLSAQKRTFESKPTASGPGLIWRRSTQQLTAAGRHSAGDLCLRRMHRLHATPHPVRQMPRCHCNVCAVVRQLLSIAASLIDSRSLPFKLLEHVAIGVDV